MALPKRLEKIAKVVEGIWDRTHFLVEIGKRIVAIQESLYRIETHLGTLPEGAESPSSFAAPMTERGYLWTGTLAPDPQPPLTPTEAKEVETQLEAEVHSDVVVTGAGDTLTHEAPTFADTGAPIMDHGTTRPMPPDIAEISPASAEAEAVAEELAYDSYGASEIIDRANSLSWAERKALHAYESAHKGRVTVLAALMPEEKA